MKDLAGILVFINHEMAFAAAKSKTNAVNYHQKSLHDKYTKIKLNQTKYMRNIRNTRHK